MFFLIFLKECNIVNIKIILFFIGPLLLVHAFLVFICFSSSSINTKKNFWGVAHLLHFLRECDFLALNSVFSYVYNYNILNASIIFCCPFGNMFFIWCSLWYSYWHLICFWSHQLFEAFLIILCTVLCPAKPPVTSNAF